MKRVFLSILLCAAYGKAASVNFDLYYLEDFDTAMFIEDATYYYELLYDDQYTCADMELFKKNYQQHLMEVVKDKKPIICTQENTIPKIIHQIWLGGPLPEDLKQLQETWIALHPDWEFKVWTEQDLETFHLINQASFENGVNYGEKANVWRYEILYRYGGLYVDVDFECLKPFDLFHHWCDFYTGIHELNWLCRRKGADKLTCSNALIGSRPGHPILKALIDNMQYHTQEEEQFHRNGVFYFGNTVKSMLAECPGTNLILPQNYFYAWRKKADGPYRWVQKETMAIHHFAGSWKNNNRNRRKDKRKKKTRRLKRRIQ